MYMYCVYEDTENFKEKILIFNTQVKRDIEWKLSYNLILRSF